MWRGNGMAILVAAAAVTACGEPTGGRAIASTPAAVASAKSVCPASIDFVVSDEAGLLAAIAAASPGQVIGVNGTIAVSTDVVITTPGITLTCATAGSGLVAGPAVFEIVNALADGIVVDGLVLDGSNALGGPYTATNASGLHLTHSQITCGSDCGVFSANTPNAVISDNQFVSNGSFTGLHLQQGIDGSSVLRNTLIANAPSGSVAFGALRIRDGSGVTISGNVVTGPWQNSLAMADLTQSQVTNNRLQGALLYGIQARTGAAFLTPASMSDNLFRGNQVTGAGVAGIRLDLACRNTLIGNSLQGNAGNIGVVLTVSTGANVLSGNNAIVVDNSAFDCNGDGVNDPNVSHGRPAPTVVAGLSAHVAGLAESTADTERLR